MKKKEKWKSIPGYVGIYKVSNRGRVRSVSRVIPGRDGRLTQWPGRILKPGDLISASGKIYKVVSLWKGNKGKMFQVHRLVAQAFIPNPNNLPEVNHKDTNPSNNRVRNLEWVTHKGNMRHAKRMGVMSNTCGRNGNSKLKIDDIPVIRLRLVNGEQIQDVAKDYRVSPACISKVWHGKTWTEV